jgi:mRNA interferase RelE/StbE
VPFEIIWSDPASKALKKLDRPVAKRIFEAVGRLAKDTFHNVTRLVNSPYYRLRVGDYRIVFDIQEDIMRVLILKVGHRKSIYD